jgi:hypothetical protein
MKEEVIDAYKSDSGEMIFKWMICQMIMQEEEMEKEKQMVLQ